MQIKELLKREIRPYGRKDEIVLKALLRDIYNDVLDNCYEKDYAGYIDKKFTKLFLKEIFFNNNVIKKLLTEPFWKYQFILQNQQLKGQILNSRLNYFQEVGGIDLIKMRIKFGFFQPPLIFFISFENEFSEKFPFKENLANLLEIDQVVWIGDQYIKLLEILIKGLRTGYGIFESLCDKREDYIKQSKSCMTQKELKKINNFIFLSQPLIDNLELHNFVNKVSCIKFFFSCSVSKGNNYYIEYILNAIIRNYTKDKEMPIERALEHSIKKFFRNRFDNNLSGKEVNEKFIMNFIRDDLYRAINVWVRYSDKIYEIIGKNVQGDYAKVLDIARRVQALLHENYYKLYFDEGLTTEKLSKFLKFDQIKDFDESIKAITTLVKEIVLCKEMEAIKVSDADKISNNNSLIPNKRQEVFQNEK